MSSCPNYATCARCFHLAAHIHTHTHTHTTVKYPDAMDNLQNYGARQRKNPELQTAQGYE